MDEVLGGFENDGERITIHLKLEQERIVMAKIGGLLQRPLSECSLRLERLNTPSESQFRIFRRMHLFPRRGFMRRRPGAAGKQPENGEQDYKEAAELAVDVAIMHLFRVSGKSRGSCEASKLGWAGLSSRQGPVLVGQQG